MKEAKRKKEAERVVTSEFEGYQLDLPPDYLDGTASEFLRDSTDGCEFLRTQNECRKELHDLKWTKALT